MSCLKIKVVVYFLRIHLTVFILSTLGYNGRKQIKLYVNPSNHNVHIEPQNYKRDDMTTS